MGNDRPSPRDSGEVIAPALVARDRLESLLAERARALLDGHPAPDAIAVDAARAAYVGAAVTELACLRATLDGPLLG